MSVHADLPRRQYLFQHTDGRVEVFTAIAEYRDGEVTLTDIQDHRWLSSLPEKPHWSDLIHDHCYGGEE